MFLLRFLKKKFNEQKAWEAEHFAETMNKDEINEFVKYSTKMFHLMIPVMSAGILMLILAGEFGLSEIPILVMGTFVMLYMRFLINVAKEKALSMEDEESSTTSQNTHNPDNEFSKVFSKEDERNKNDE